MLHGPDFVLFHVPDITGARQFYADTLGLQVEVESPDFVQFKPAGGATFALGREDGGEPVELWWFVEDADAAHRELASRGVEVVREPENQPFGRTLAIRDTAGNTLNLLQPAA